MRTCGAGVRAARLHRSAGGGGALCGQSVSYWRTHLPASTLAKLVRDAGGVVAYKFDQAEKKYKVFWSQSGGSVNNTGQKWGGVSVHDLNDDGKPEVLLEDAVFNGQDGSVLGASKASSGFNGLIPAVADMDGDGEMDYTGMVANEAVLMNLKGDSWDSGLRMDRINLGAAATQFALADFGSEVDGTFDSSSSFSGTSGTFVADDDPGRARPSPVVGWLTEL